MQDYEVQKPLEVTDEAHPLFGVHEPGAVLSVGTDAAAEPSFVQYIEDGFIKLVEKAEAALEGAAASKEEVAETDSTEAAPAAAESTTAVAPAVAPAAAPVSPTTAARIAPTAAPVVAPASTAAAEATAALQSKFPTPPAPFAAVPPMLYAFCKAIEGHEVCVAPGVDARFPQGTRAYFNKNPGNLKFRNQAGAIAEDRDGFAVFDTVEDGFMALVHQVELAISGKSQAYKNPIWDATLKAWRHINFLDFFAIYDSSAGDDPIAYANDVAKAMDVPVDTVINQLV